MRFLAQRNFSLDIDPKIPPVSVIFKIPQQVTNSFNFKLACGSNTKAQRLLLATDFVPAIHIQPLKCLEKETHIISCCVSWDFLKQVMTKMGLDSKMVKSIMYCIRSVIFLVLNNGEPRGNIIPSRWIRQGDPLSPFLFLFCTKGLISLLNLVESEDL